ncbi:MAG TPA: hypothetical protein VE843_12890, partial [Ktedonobacteraceae bacterium]|nr:hypothetical protein [Ktedonobacteraceae bacterium]
IHSLALEDIISDGRLTAVRIAASICLYGTGGGWNHRFFVLPAAFAPLLHIKIQSVSIKVQIKIEEL